MRSKGSRRRICPHRLAVPEKIFALLACSIFSTAAGEGASGRITSGSNFRLCIMPSCYRFAVTPHKMRRRHLESVSSRSLSVRGSWGAAPSAFWYGAPGGTQGPLGKGGAAERWRVTPSVGWVTRHGAQPATTRAYKSRPRRVGMLTKPCKRPRPAEGEMKLWHNLCHQSLRLISFATSLYTREAFAGQAPANLA